MRITVPGTATTGTVAAHSMLRARLDVPAWNRATSRAPTLEAARAVRPLFEAVGRKIIFAGEGVGEGTTLRLSRKAWIASITVPLARSPGMATALGIQPALVLEAIDGGQSDSPYEHLKGKGMLADRYPVSFAVGGATKDLGIMVDAALGAEIPQILLRPLHELYSRAGAAAHNHYEISAVIRSSVQVPDADRTQQTAPGDLRIRRREEQASRPARSPGSPPRPAARPC